MHHHDQAPHADSHGHGHSLAEDMATLRRLLARRDALKWFAGTGTLALLSGCGNAESSDDVVIVTDVTPTLASTATPTSTSTATTIATTCIADPTETAGPYPADGTNASSGSTANALTVSGIVRSDIRASFIGTTTVATGTQLRITLTLVDVDATCAPLANYAVYLWQCDRNGDYSLYSAPTESYLRGVQVTDAAGQVTFTTIVPGCYDGRYPHMHFEVFSSLTAATGGRHAILTSQLAMPAALCNAVYADTTLYPASATRFATISTSSDNVFGDNTAAQVAQQTPTFAGSVADGYTASAVIGITR
ncbi:dioxygenase family protein [Sphingomonas faeni]|uniref:dioxygenase family protein n=1 Tax=Sphingomonas faeni TaxID=185950 RepID=UPI0020C749D2|nr:intradiol ring-cleavage dioxygenase [Sphingomonas faeni]MCP8890408.1 intradiol ring-cleavage dioxygenase [Sphingomonas faeni]